MSEPRTYTVAQAAEILGVSKFSIYGAIRRSTLDPRIRVIRIGQTIRLAKSDVDALVNRKHDVLPDYDADGR